MDSNIGDIQGGMDVYGLDGERIGAVMDVFLSPHDPETPTVRETIEVPLPPHLDGPLNDGAEPGGNGLVMEEVHPADTATIAPTTARESYFTVEGNGEHYEVPFGEVTTVFPGQNVTLICTRAECARLYGAAAMR